METTKPISAITYNTKEFLNEKLSTLLNNGYINYYAYVYHLGEKNESKNHIHLLIIPAKALDTIKLKGYFNEPDIEHPDKPLGLFKPFDITKNCTDWYLYGIHDEVYCQLHCSENELPKKYHYSIDDVITNSKDFVQEIAHGIPSKVPNAKMYKATWYCVVNGMNMMETAEYLQVDWSKITQFREFYKEITKYIDSDTPAHPKVYSGDEFVGKSYVDVNKETLVICDNTDILFK